MVSELDADELGEADTEGVPEVDALKVADAVCVDVMDSVSPPVTDGVGDSLIEAVSEGERLPEAEPVPPCEAVTEALDEASCEPEDVALRVED